MVTREECLLKAEDCERLAGESDTEATRSAFLTEARKWRVLADKSDAERSLVDTPDTVRLKKHSDDAEA
jgi:hypothetical protein